ncbi:hypothetical protein L2X99_12815 [Microbacterium sp. KUDC0406]|uniref:hypothetical protein n=1 Tax=Microbacterium sp. KUDC0406 TaxID=2909588 RepID=UPI001F425C95|nr:hypothetical protein [Microbacterium sp. KUDC0406]UJP09310.1 hypothetical protein L2X99_12815 [Microbacterium sp. KUDC0406]
MPAELFSTYQHHPRTRRSRALTALVATVVVMMVAFFGASPAMAEGHFTQKVTPGSCTQTDWSGETLTPSKTGWTKNGSVICVTHLMDTIRLNRGGVYGSTKTSTGGYVSTTLSGNGTLYGTHQLCVYVAAGLYNCDFTRYT